MTSDEDAQDQRHPVPDRQPAGTAWRLLGVLGGALARVARAAPDYLGSSSPRARVGSDADTGEWPAPDTSSDAERPSS